MSLQNSGNVFVNVACICITVVVDCHPPWLGVERNRKQEFGSFQELLDLVPATFSPTCSAGPLFVLTSCFIYNVTLSGRTAFILGYLVLTEICKQKTETITSVNQNYHQVLGFEFGKVKLANKKVKLNNKFLKSILDSWNIIRKITILKSSWIT